MHRLRDNAESQPKTSPTLYALTRTRRFSQVAHAMTDHVARSAHAAAFAAVPARAQAWLWWRDLTPRAALLERW
jgi:hypothetical protein